MKVNTFLSKTKIVFDSLVQKRVVIGNQSADLDSIVSSISMAFYLTSKVHNSVPYVPIINSTKSLIKTKKECMFLFDYLSIDIERDLVFINEWKKDIDDVILVDHNELDSKEKELEIEDKVSAIIDHHLDKKLFMNAEPRIVDTAVGSCSTLIANLFFQSNIQLDASFAAMMMFPILSDTNNLTCRASEQDKQIAQHLNTIAKIDPKWLYLQIEKFKFDISDEDLITLLNKDYKQYVTNSSSWGMSSVNFSVHEWIQKSKDDLIKVKKFMQEKNLFFYAILSCYKNLSEFKRDLILVGDKTLILNFEENMRDNVSSVEKNEYCGLNYILYDVDQVSFTRKYFQPELEKIIKMYI
ncbi:exopolyphosphatase [Brachionus plicatilis]|uniref:Exopolyphosphatase n=1 Tax=Brachionus plicatilis TaxID=10195 RepID=A0A3M7PGN6_BRAPC|nr:exopolyphosphatase [Brachionus plicatilis]